MALTFLDLQNEVKRRSMRDQAGTTYDTAIKNLINSSLLRIAREAKWRVLRRKSTFSTVKTYDTDSGNGIFVESATTMYVPSATFLTDSIEVGRRVKLSGDSVFHKIETVPSETSFTIERAYDGTSTTEGTYSILGQEEYNLPIQADHRMFMWHEEYGYPYKLDYVTDQDFYGRGVHNTEEGTPIAYRMWGSDMVKEQLRDASTLSVVSSYASDNNVTATIFGIVSGYPDYENISTNSTDSTIASAGSKSFSFIERVVKNVSTTGRITVTANSGNTTVAVLPVGDTTAGINYSKIQLYPLPDTNFDINVQYYKDPYRLVNDYDVHELGADFDEAIILLSVAKIKYESSQTEGDKWFGMYQDEVKNLRKNNVDKMDFFPKLQREYGKTNDRVHPYLYKRQFGSYF